MTSTEDLLKRARSLLERAKGIKQQAGTAAPIEPGPVRPGLARPLDATDIRIDGPCSFVAYEDFPMGLVRGLEMLEPPLNENSYVVVRVSVPGTDDHFLIDDEESGDRLVARAQKGPGGEVLFTAVDEWPTLLGGDKVAEALTLFVGACSAGTNHSASWEETEAAGTQLTKDEFEALYCMDVETLARILA